MAVQAPGTQAAPSRDDDDSGAPVSRQARRPAEFPRRVLLTVSGLTPQIVTETLYALAVAAAPDSAFVPTEILVLTTAEGARRARLALLSETPGAFHALRADYALPDIRFDAASIQVVCNAAGRPLDDIRSASDNAAMADAITDLARQLCADPDCALHVSLAGGRKTMGYYAGYALSLFGREQDRLSHVLVSPPFESSWDFFYPTPTSRVLSADGGRQLVDAATAEVSLAQIPFVRLRQGLPAALLAGRASFAETVHAANAGLAPAALVLDVVRRSLRADGVAIGLTPMQFALMAVLAHRARFGRPALKAPLRDAHDPEWAADVLTDLRAALGLMHVPAGVEDSLNQDCSGNKLSPHFSKLRKRLAEDLAPGRAALYFDDGGTHRHKRYRVPLGAQAVRFVGAGVGQACRIDLDRTSNADSR